MTIQEKKQSVKEAIIRAVPSVMDLKMGCILWKRTYEYMIIDYRHISSIGATVYSMYQTYNGELVHADGREILKYKIIGRPITLADVIYTHLQNLIPARFLTSGYKEGMELQYTDAPIMDIVAHWNLLDDDFDHQSEAVWEFLWSLLCE